MSSGAEGEKHDGAMQGMDAVPQVEKLCTPAVEHTRGHISRLRGMVREQTKLRLPAGICRRELSSPKAPFVHERQERASP